ncbi:MAG: hypothetical protein ACP5LN_09640 [Thermoproteota archaeon]
MNTYRGIGLSLAFAGAILAALTYFFFGIMPLVALWVGILIIGVTMFITPEEQIKKEDLLAVVEDMLSNLSMLFEAVGVSSVATYVSYGDSVYAFVSEKPIEKLPKEPPKSMLINLGYTKALVLRSPLSSISDKILIEGSDMSTVASYVLVELLEIADDVMCSEEAEVISCSVANPKLSTPARLEKTLGSIYSSILASIAASVYKCPVVLVHEEESRGKRMVVLRKIRNE